MQAAWWANICGYHQTSISPQLRRGRGIRVIVKYRYHLNALELQQSRRPSDGVELGKGFAYCRVRTAVFDGEYVLDRKIGDCHFHGTFLGSKRHFRVLL